VIDDYASKPGCKRAVDDYFSDKRTHFDFSFTSRLHITRKEA
jgi:hypothetical protein